MDRKITITLKTSPDNPKETKASVSMDHLSFTDIVVAMEILSSVIKHLARIVLKNACNVSIGAECGQVLVFDKKGEPDEEDDFDIGDDPLSI